MIQTKKKYTYRGNKFEEDQNGYILGYEWTDENSIKRRCLYIESVDDLVNKFCSAKCRYEMYDPKADEWILRQTDVSLATNNSFINLNTGVLETEPYEDDLDSPIYGDDLNSPIYGEDNLVGYEQKIIAYNKKLKNGLVPEFHFFYNAQMQLFSAVMDNIQTRKFGATGFN